MRTGKLKVWIDQAEHEGMDKLFEDANEFLGGLLDIQRKTLPVGDYILKAEGKKEIIFTFKEIKDFRQSFFNGHLMEEILALHLNFPENPIALVIARDEEVRTPPEVHAWVSSHWKKRNFLIPTFKFDSRRKAVEFMLDCALKSDDLQMLPRKIIHPPDYHQVVGLYQFYGVGADKAKRLAERFPIPIDLFDAMNKFAVYEDAKTYHELNDKSSFPGDPDAWQQCEGKKLTKKAWRQGRWWYGILGEKTAMAVEGLILAGAEIQKKERTNERINWGGGV